MGLAEPIETRVGVLTGWRCWCVLPDEGLLRPIYMRGLVWKPRQPFEAACPEQIHAVPADGCKCGIWAVCHPMLLAEVQWTQAPPKGVQRLPGALVVGQVALWGSIIEHERGWRGQFAYPTQLYALTDHELLAQTLRERYLVPVAFGREAAVLEQILPPQLRNLRRARAGAAASKRAAFSDVPSIPCSTPTIVEMIHTQEMKRLDRAREAAQRKREEVERERKALDVERREVEAQRQRLAAELDQLALDAARKSAARQEARVASTRTLTGRQAAVADLKRLLREHGITQRDIAEHADVTRPLVTNVLAGRRASQPVLAAAKQLLGLGADLLTLRRRMRAAGITQRMVAIAAGTQAPNVANVLAGRYKSRAVIDAAERLIAARVQGGAA